jgi:hypothetical protein
MMGLRDQVGTFFVGFVGLVSETLGEEHIDDACEDYHREETDRYKGGPPFVDEGDDDISDEGDQAQHQDGEESSDEGVDSMAVHGQPS